MKQRIPVCDGTGYLQPDQAIRQITKRFELLQWKSKNGYWTIEDITRCFSNKSQQEAEMLYLMEAFFELNVCNMYSIASGIAKELGFQQVVDIGCAAGLQADLFEYVGVDYIGVDCSPYHSHSVWCKDYRQGKYPFDFCRSLPKNALAISRLCVGYLITSNFDYDTLAQDFEYLLLSAPPECVAEMRKWYKNEIIIAGTEGENWHYFFK